jgi:hypothetical protein
MTNLRVSKISSIVVLIAVGLAGPALADPGSAGSDAAAAPAPAAADARKACSDAMNADPRFAADIVKVADERAAKQRDDDTLKAHQDAAQHVQKNELHVIYAYAGMWIIAAAFVVFLWRRQQALQDEIANLRRELEAAADDSTSAKGRT